MTMDGGSSGIKVLFVHTQMLSFMRKDLETLSRSFDVRLADCGTIRQTWRSLMRVPKSDLLFCWFGSLRYLPVALLGWLLGKPIIIVCGGYDVAREPAIGYGNMNRFVTRWLGRLLFALANRVVGFSEFSCREAIEHAWVPSRKLGLIYLGFTEHDIPDPPAVKEPIVLSVGFANASSLLRKGILTVAKVSRLVPEIRIVITGHCDEESRRMLQAAAGPNVEFTGYVDAEALQALFARAAVYLQPSLHEGFGCAVAEAMLAGCTPIVSRFGSLTEVAGPFGTYVDPHDLTAIAKAIRMAVRTTVRTTDWSANSPPRLPPAASRRWILDRFPGGLRARRLEDLVLALTSPELARRKESDPQIVRPSLSPLQYRG